MNQLRGRYARLATTVAGGIVVVVALAACGSGSGGASQASSSAPSRDTSADVANAKANLAKYDSTAPPKLPGPPFDASGARGKVVALVYQQSQNPAVASVGAAVKTALTHEGVTVRTCDAKGASTAISSCIQQGLAQGAKVVDVIGGDPTSYSAGLKKAQQAGVPLISALDVPTPDEIKASGVDPGQAVSKLSGIKFDAAPPDALSGTLMADYIIAHSNGHAKGLFIASPGIVGSDFLKKAFDVELKKNCADCDFDTKNVIILNWPSDLPSVVNAYLARNPDANYVVPVFDPMTAYTNPAIRSAGKSDSVKVVTANGSLQQMLELKKKDVLVADAGQDLPEVGFLAADQTLRLLVGKDVSTSAQAGALRFFSQENIADVNVTQKASTTGEWFTGSATALPEAYYKLWSGRK